MVKAVELVSRNGRYIVRLLEQRDLPGEINFVDCKTCKDVARGIEEMTVRGAPAIGVAAAYGYFLAALECLKSQESLELLEAQESKLAGTADEQNLKKSLNMAYDTLLATRPTAVNLKWALDRMKSCLNGQTSSRATLIEVLQREADQIFNEDVSLCRRIGENGADLIPEKARILTHCNAGALATAGYGTALGVIRWAFFEQKKEISVWVDETRPYLQGARLTAWELMQDKIDCTLICDNMAGYLMGLGCVDAVIVGADRIASNGDSANKIGSYSLAILARYHKIPFYVAAPYSTVDDKISSGSEIKIEERSPKEVTHVGFSNPQNIAPANVKVFNPAFDVIPADLISAIITDKQVFRAPFSHLKGGKI